MFVSSAGPGAAVYLKKVCVVNGAFLLMFKNKASEARAISMATGVKYSPIVHVCTRLYSHIGHVCKQDGASLWLYYQVTV